MSPLVTVLLLGALLAAPESGGAAPAQTELKVWAVELDSQGRAEAHFDSGLEEIRDALKDPKHDTYRNLRSSRHGFKDAKPFKTALTDQYTLDTSAPARSADGRYRVKLRLTMKEEKPETPPPGNGASSLLRPDGLAPTPPRTTPAKPREIEALSSDLLLQPGKQVVIRGLKTEEGKDMVLVVSLSVPREGAER